MPMKSWQSKCWSRSTWTKILYFHMVL